MPGTAKKLFYIQQLWRWPAGERSSNAIFQAEPFHDYFRINVPEQYTSKQAACEDDIYATVGGSWHMGAADPDALSARSQSFPSACVRNSTLSLWHPARGKGANGGQNQRLVQNGLPFLRALTI